MSTTRQEQEFKKAIEGEIEANLNISSSLLDTCIEFISSNFNPDQVFREDALIEWGKSCDPDGIFESSVLESWAESNGYTKEDTP